MKKSFNFVSVLWYSFCHPFPIRIQTRSDPPKIMSLNKTGHSTQYSRAWWYKTVLHSLESNSSSANISAFFSNLKSIKYRPSSWRNGWPTLPLLHPQKSLYYWHLNIMFLFCVRLCTDHCLSLVSLLNSIKSVTRLWRTMVCQQRKITDTQSGKMQVFIWMKLQSKYISGNPRWRTLFGNYGLFIYWSVANYQISNNDSAYIIVQKHLSTKVNEKSKSK